MSNSCTLFLIPGNTLKKQNTIPKTGMSWNLEKILEINFPTLEIMCNFISRILTNKILYMKVKPLKK